MSRTSTGTGRALRALGVMAASAAAVATFPLASSAATSATPSCTTADGVIPATSGGSHHCVMGVGNGGSAVTALQRSLRACEGQSIAVDGIYGPATRDAVLNVQRRAGIARDGVYGPQTRDAMRWHIGADCVSYQYGWG
ncbi:Putative peptidoglycan binding domain-containing protein [Actinopolyspora xinjiangensis]|uniref:Putative peptidoglycan binding domain-containing protein n=1 Tax=Actinopolyspora xinjiangensis TaxID=405564 RepID=A0A1H0W8E8_9ACTN|nr:peptidoglycan-binding domain-containing protein [Actinopolyspora xinjiangensis]SDP87052.1 Putative peptidoglycan binding domain-containing protein [Actinopolyspora xinjiangensis]